MKKIHVIFLGIVMIAAPMLAMDGANNSVGQLPNNDTIYSIEKVSRYNSWGDEKICFIS